MNKVYTAYYNSPIGWLKINTTQRAVTSITFCKNGNENPEIQPTILTKCITQLNEYFAGTRHDFNISILPDGSEFQQKIWNLVQQIPYGKTTSYLNLAIKSGSAKNTRAVGMANGKNPLPIIVPCHRVIGSNGKLIGYAGGMEKKRWLILHEQAHSQQAQTLF